jgi:hypothetical protein
MSQPAATPPDPRRAVRPSAIASIVLLVAASLTGLLASGGDTVSVIHGVTVAFALPVTFAAHLIAIVASGSPPSDPS